MTPATRIRIKGSSFQFYFELFGTLYTATLQLVVVRVTQLGQSCPWVGLTHGLGWVGLGRYFSVSGLLGWVHYSKSTKI